MINYREIVNKLREGFPQPVTDRERDNYLIQTFDRALQQVTELKSQSPILGEKEDLTPYYQAAKHKKLWEDSSTVERVTRILVNHLEGMTIWGHPLTQENVIPPPSIPALVGMMLAGLYNPLLLWDEYSHRVAQAEIEVVAMMADLIGYDPEKASGVFTFGGTGTVFYGMKVALEKTFPQAMKVGVGQEKGVIFVSNRSHYCGKTVAGWLGLGMDTIIEIPTDESHAMDTEILRKAVYKTLGETEYDHELKTVLKEKNFERLSHSPKIIGFICTMGTTDHFGLDDLEKVAKIRDELTPKLGYTPHIHADAVIGWAWSVFNDYFGDEYEHDPLQFRTQRQDTFRSLVFVSKKIRHLHKADSLGIDFHKTGFAPCISSLVLFKNGQDFNLLRRDQKEMPYLYQFGEYHPGEYTIETTRSGVGILAALANLKFFGKQGLQAMLGYLVEMRLRLCEGLRNDPHITVLNDEHSDAEKGNYGTVTLFRVYPNRVTTPVIHQELTQSEYADRVLYYNAYNICIEEYLHQQAMLGHGVVLSRTDKYRSTQYEHQNLKQKIGLVALKSYILSPFVNEESVDLVWENVKQARTHVDQVKVGKALKELLRKTFDLDEKTLHSETQRILNQVY